MAVTAKRWEHALACHYLIAVLALAFGQGLLPGRSLTMAHELALSDDAFRLESGPLPLGAPVYQPVRPSDPAPVWFSYPMDVLAARQFRTGEWPTWNPYNGFGAPLLAAGESAPFFPLKLLLYLFPTMAAYPWYLVSRHVLAAIGTYALARTTGIGLAGALVAAQAFSLCGFLLTDFQHVDSTPLALLPLLVWTVEATLVRLRGAALACGLALGITVLSGHPETALYVLAAAGAYAAIRLIGMARTTPRATLAASVRLAGAAALGLALSLIATVPLVELARSRPSYVSAGSYATVSLRVAAEQFWSLIFGFLQWPVISDAHPLRPAIYFVIVNVYSGPLAVWAICARLAGASQRLPRPLWVFGGLAGALALVLPPAALVVSPLRIQSYYATGLIAFSLALLSGWVLEQLIAPNRRPARRWLEPAAAALFFALGFFHVGFWAALVPLALWWLVCGPLGAWLRSRARAVRYRRDGLLTSESTTPAGVIAIGLGAALITLPPLLLALPPAARLLSSVAAVSRNHFLGDVVTVATSLAVTLVWVAAAVAIVAFGAGRSSHMLRRAVAIVAVLLTGAVGFGAAHRIAPATPAFDYPVTPLVSTVQRETAGARFAAIDADVLRGNTSTVYGIHDVRLSYVFHSCRYRLFVAAVNGADPGGRCVVEQFGNNLAARRPHPRLLSVAGVRLAGIKDDKVALDPPPDDWRSAWRLHDVTLYELPGALPRAYFVGRGRHCAAGGRAALVALANGDVDPSREVLLEDTLADAALERRAGVPADRCADGDPIRTGASPASVRIVEHRSTYVQLETSQSEAGYVVLAEAAAPGWIATVDGAPTPLFTANFLFRAVPVAAGARVVELRYEAPGFAAGRAVTLAALVLTAASLAWSALRRTGGHTDPSRAALWLGAALCAALALTFAGFAPHPPLP